MLLRIENTGGLADVTVGWDDSLLSRLVRFDTSPMYTEDLLKPIFMLNIIELPYRGYPIKERVFYTNFLHKDIYQKAMALDSFSKLFRGNASIVRQRDCLLKIIDTLGSFLKVSIPDSTGIPTIRKPLNEFFIVAKGMLGNEPMLVKVS